MLDANRDASIDCILISCGANDIDDKTGLDVARDIISIVNRIKVEHPTTKIVLSEVTQYKARDNEVQAYNEHLHSMLSEAENVTLVKHDNLRNETWSKFRDDGKHINHTSMNIFAGNLKGGLRRALNINRYNQSRTYREIQQDQNERLIPPSQPKPLMSNMFAQPRNGTGVPINQRLLGISQNKQIRNPKQDLILKLNDVIKCLQVW